MRRYLVQYGDAVPERLDPERPLSPAGRREVEAVAHLFASTGARVVRVAHSGKLRAQQTAELLATPWRLAWFRTSCKVLTRTTQSSLWH